MANDAKDYPAQLSIDYPKRDLNKLTTFFRVFTIIPIAIILGLLSGSSLSSGMSSDWNWDYAYSGIVVLPLVLMILFRKKYPKWWFDWNLAMTKFAMRVAAYFSLLDDKYPSTDEEQSVHVKIDYPNAEKELGRGMPLIKWFLAIPHYIILCFLGIAVVFCIIISWFAILFNGRYPAGLFDFVVGVYRWGLRVEAYALMMTTDKYPPFSLD